MNMTLDELRAIPDPLVRAQQATLWLRENDLLIETALKIRAEAVRECRAAGQTLRGIGNIIGLTPERVRSIAQLPEQSDD